MFWFCWTTTWSCVGTMSRSCFSKWGVGRNFIHRPLALHYTLSLFHIIQCIIYTNLNTLLHCDGLNFIHRHLPRLIHRQHAKRPLERGHLSCLSFQSSWRSWWSWGLWWPQWSAWLLWWLEWWLWRSWWSGWGNACPISLFFLSTLPCDGKPRLQNHVWSQKFLQ